MKFDVGSAEAGAGAFGAGAGFALDFHSGKPIRPGLSGHHSFFGSGTFSKSSPLPLLFHCFINGVLAALFTSACVSFTISVVRKNSTSLWF